MPCRIETFDPKLPTAKFMAKRQAVSRNIMTKTQEAALNPQLKRCGRIDICIGCEILVYAQVLEMSERVAQRIASE